MVTGKVANLCRNKQSTACRPSAAWPFPLAAAVASADPQDSTATLPAAAAAAGPAVEAQAAQML